MSLEFFTNADALGKIFWSCAVGGSLFFMLRTLLMIFGGDFDMDDGADGFDGDAADHASDVHFEVLSINSVTAFFMMFGWTGLTCYIQYQLHAITSIAIAFVAGVISMLIVAYMFKLARKLVSTGGKFSIEQVVGFNATVYQMIPAGGRGKINVTGPGGLYRELEAVAAKKDEEIASFTTVKIVKIIDKRTVAVKKIQ